MNKKLWLILFFNLILLFPSVSFAEKWSEEKSNHFIIYYKNAPKDFIENVTDSAEEYYSSITRDLGFTRFEAWLWDERAMIYIYDGAEDYLNATKQPSWSGGSAAFREKKISTYPMASGFFDTLLPHELGHIIFREFVGDRHDLPLWLEEGVASCQERARRYGSSKKVKEAIAQKKFIPLPELGKVHLFNTQDKEFVELFYAESGSVIYFLLTEFNRRNFVDFCKALKDGKEFNASLHEGYPRFDNLEDLNQAWLRYLENE